MATVTLVNSQVTSAPALNCVPINLAASGDLVAAVAGKQIVVVSYMLVNTTVTTTLKFQSGGSTDLTGTMTSAQSTIAYGSDEPAFATLVGEKLNIVLGASTQVSGHLTYYTV